MEGEVPGQVSEGRGKTFDADSWKRVESYPQAGPWESDENPGTGVRRAKTLNSVFEGGLPFFSCLSFPKMRAILKRIANSLNLYAMPTHPRSITPLEPSTSILLLAGEVHISCRASRCTTRLRSKAVCSTELTVSTAAPRLSAIHWVWMQHWNRLIQAQETSRWYLPSNHNRTHVGPCYLRVASLEMLASGVQSSKTRLRHQSQHILYTSSYYSSIIGRGSSSL